MKKVVLVTGVSGFLGCRLCHALRKKAYGVKAFVRKTSDLSTLPLPTNGGATGGTLYIAYGDVTDYPSFLKLSLAATSSSTLLHLLSPGFLIPLYSLQ